MSPAKDLGTKHICWKCETKFYDLRKAVPLCPKCGADQRESPALKNPVKEPRKPAPKAAKVRPVVEDSSEDEDELLVEKDELDDDEGADEEEEEELE